MKVKIHLLIALVTTLPSLYSNPAKVNAADFNKALVMEETTADSISHVEVIERIETLEKEVYFLDQQLLSISRQLFENHGLYIIRPGDTLEKIAINHEAEIREILDLNKGLNPRKLEVGQIVKLRNRETGS